MAGISAAIRAAGLIGGRGAAGGAAGGAIGGGGGLGGGLADILGNLSGDIGQVGKAAEGAGDGFGLLKDVLGRTHQSLGKLTPDFGSLTKQLPLLSAALMPLTAGFAGLEKGVDLFNEFVAVTSQLTQKYTAAFAPAEAELFNEALRDLNAVIGEQLVPVTRAARDVIRWVGDALDGLTPLFRGLIEDGLDKLRPVFSTLGETFQRLMTFAQPFLQLFGEVFVEVLGFVATQVEHAAASFNSLLESLRLFLGLPEFKMGNALGKAATSVSTTSVQAFGSRIDQEAFRLGSSNPQERQANLLEGVADLLRNLPKRMAAEWVAQFEKSPIGQAMLAANGAKDRAVGGAVAWGAAAIMNLPRFDERH